MRLRPTRPRLRRLVAVAILVVVLAVALPGPPGGAQAGHEHGVDPVGAALLVLDGIVVLTVAVLLMRRPRGR